MNKAQERAMLNQRVKNGQYYKQVAEILSVAICSAVLNHQNFSTVVDMASDFISCETQLHGEDNALPYAGFPFRGLVEASRQDRLSSHEKTLNEIMKKVLALEINNE